MSVASVLALTLVLLTPGQPAQEIGREAFGVWLCPIHRDEQATVADSCPVCGRDMVERLLAPSYSCPMHQHIDQEHEGECPICGMNLVSTTRELQWFCPDAPEILSAVPGECPDGADMLMRSIPMAHGDHNPKHGGILFMAPNGYNHLEGTLDEDGNFRLYLYNDFTKPIDATPFEARVNDEALAPVDGGAYLSAALGRPAAYPAEYVVELSFPGTHEERARFDFIFAESMLAGAVSEPADDVLVLPEFRVPETADGIYAAIKDRDDRIKELIDNGVWPDLYIPALEAKDLVLALIDKEPDVVGVPAKKLVRAAWLLDVYGDMGNRVEIERAYGLFAESILELEVARAR